MNNINNFKIHKEFQKDYIGTYRNNPNIFGDKIILNGPKIEYFLNKNFFRSQDFDNFNNENINILCGGDSYTFGEALPEEYIWPNLLKKIIKEKINKDIEIYNIASSGASIRQIIKNCMAFIRKHGNPNCIILLLPDSTRDIIYDSISDQFILGFYSKKWANSERKKFNFDKKRFFYGVNEYESLFYAIDTMFMFEDFCESKGINLIWTSYSNREYKYFSEQLIYEQIGFKYFFTEIMDISTNINKMPYWEKAADDAHPGTKWHYNFAKQVYNILNDIDKI